MQLIGINGLKGSGKGTAAAMISKYYPGNVKLVGFSDKLKIVAGRALGFEGDNNKIIEIMDVMKDDGIIVAGDGTQALLATTDGRKYIQNLGNTAREVFGRDFWIDQVLPQPAMEFSTLKEAERNTWLLECFYPLSACVVFTDLRYPNEAERIRALGGQVWEVVRPGVESDGHVSEQKLPNQLISRIIVNSGDLIDLEYMIEASVKALDA